MAKNFNADGREWPRISADGEGRISTRMGKEWNANVRKSEPMGKNFNANEEGMGRE